MGKTAATYLPCDALMRYCVQKIFNKNNKLRKCSSQRNRVSRQSHAVPDRFSPATVAATLAEPVDPSHRNSCYRTEWWVELSPPVPESTISTGITEHHVPTLPGSPPGLLLPRSWRRSGRGSAHRCPGLMPPCRSRREPSPGTTGGHQRAAVKQLSLDRGDEGPARTSPHSIGGLVTPKRSASCQGEPCLRATGWVPGAR